MTPIVSCFTASYIIGFLELKIYCYEDVNLTILSFIMSTFDSNFIIYLYVFILVITVTIRIKYKEYYK